MGGLSVLPMPLVMPLMKLLSLIVLPGVLPPGPHRTFHLAAIKVQYPLSPQATKGPPADTLAFPIDDLVI